MLVIWPISDSLAPLVLFVIINGAGNGGFFSTMPTVVGSVFGSRRVSVAMGMIVTGWGGGYLMVSPNVFIPLEEMVNSCVGCSNCWLPSRGIRRRAQYFESLSSCHLLRWINGSRSCWPRSFAQVKVKQESSQKVVREDVSGGETRASPHFSCIFPENNFTDALTSRDLMVYSCLGKPCSRC